MDIEDLKKKLQKKQKQLCALHLGMSTDMNEIKKIAKNINLF